MGTPGAFENLFDQHAEALLSFLTLRTGDRTLAEDLVADTFERVLRKGHHFDRSRGSEKTWLFTIALNLHRDHLRRVQAETRAIDTSAAQLPVVGDGALKRVEDRELLRAPLAGLPGEEAEALALRYGADLTMPEIAALINKPRSTVEGRIYRGLERLRLKLPS